MKQIKEYIVEVGYRKFRFDNAQDALNFAIVAAQTSVDEDEAEITIVTESEGEEGV